jgi:gluconokinase
MTPSPTIAMVMGVSGVGKTTVATALADRLGWSFQEGDTLHPPANIAKMGAGEPLTDDDRAPWLDQVKAWIDAQIERGSPGVITCSALKRAYRDRIRAGRRTIALVFVEGDHDLIARRLEGRDGHFMPRALLGSQFATLEPPTPDEHPIIVSAGDPPDEQLRRIEHALRSL